MKKNYLAPKSETLMAILAEICDTGSGQQGDPILPCSAPPVDW